MNLEQALTKFTHHSETIIQWLLFSILLLSGLLIARFLFSKKEATGESAELNVALQKILEQTAKLESVSLDKMSPQGVASVDAQVQALKADLQAREVEITKLKEGGVSSGKAAEEAAGLSSRIKELEAKLSEYEILEDDIADLSLYKEENTRLRGELERIKGGGAAPAPEAAAAPAAAPAPAAGDDIVAEFAQAVGVSGPSPSEAAELAELLAPQVAPPATIEVPDTGDPMADFESAVKAEKAAIGAAVATPPPAAPAPIASAPETPAPAAAPPPAAPPSVVAAPVAAGPEATAAAAPSGEAEDLFAEFAEPPPEPADPEAAGTLDTDKMMAEMAALVGMEPSAGNALEEGIDTEKMALEASSFNKS